MTTTKVGKLSFDQANILGKGSLGTAVYSGFYLRSTSASKPTAVAIKRIVKTNPDQCAVILKEAKLMKKTSHHSNVLRIIHTELNNDFL